MNLRRLRSGLQFVLLLSVFSSLAVQNGYSSNTPTTLTASQQPDFGITASPSQVSVGKTVVADYFANYSLEVKPNTLDVRVNGCGNYTVSVSSVSVLEQEVNLTVFAFQQTLPQNVSFRFLQNPIDLAKWENASTVLHACAGPNAPVGNYTLQITGYPGCRTSLVWDSYLCPLGAVTEVTLQLESSKISVPELSTQAGMVLAAVLALAAITFRRRRQPNA